MSLAKKLTSRGIETPEELLPFIEGYISRRIDDVDLMKNSLQMRNFSEIKKIAHKIKGSGGGFGFAQLTDLASRIDEAAKAQDFSETEQHIQKMESEVIGLKNLISSPEMENP